MKCRVCKSKNTVEIFDLGKQPLANKYPKNIKEIKNEKKYQLSVYFCKNCKTAQIKKLISRKLMFEDYYYLSSVNQGLRIHFQKLARKLKRFNFVVDIGSNDGILLEPLIKNKINCLGIDPSKNVGKIANDKGFLTEIGFFNRKIINRILKKYPKPDALVASSVVTHLEKPIEFAKNTKFFLKKSGILILEIEYLNNFLKNLEYERFYFDRPFYYSANSIDYIFKSINMSLFDIELINIHGSSLRLYIKNSKFAQKTKRCNKVLKEENKNLNINKLSLIKDKIIKESKLIKDKLERFKKENIKVIGYGSPARVSTITNYSKINNKLIEYIIDDSPIKQNKFTPGSHIKILPRKNNINKNIGIIIVFAYEYFADIRKRFKKMNVKFYKPIPFKKLI
tara:strand:+ start:6205 stop:7389 length:1185 start_codon:yes stop_codon:yes gene_type:complete